jgi:hypothetical protein
MAGVSKAGRSGQSGYAGTDDEHIMQSHTRKPYRTVISRLVRMRISAA